MSPEYAMHGKFSEKSDVFSFGVLVLEILSGKKNTSYYRSHEDNDDLLSFVSFELHLTCFGLVMSDIIRKKLEENILEYFSCLV